MWKLFKKFFKIHDAIPENDLSGSIQRMVNTSALNRRKNIRIRYPHFGAFGPFPSIRFHNTQLIAGNISAGGLLIIDDTDKFGSSVGEIVTLDVAWPDFNCRVRARVVGATPHKRHLQFMDLNAQAFLRITKLVKPGYAGSCFHRVRDEQGQIDAHELWVGSGSESLVFPKAGVFAELTLNGEKINFQKNQTARYTDSNNTLKPEALTEIFVTVCNLGEHTARVKSLLEIIEAEMRNAKARKTG